MRALLFIMLLGFNPVSSYCQEIVDPNYFITGSRDEYLQKLVALPCGIGKNDSITRILSKLKAFLQAYKADEKYTDDALALEANLQALKSVLEGGYGIGAVLIDVNGKILASAHNEQIQKHRSDLHGEMTLLTNFEESPQSKPFLNSYLYKPGITVFSSAEPCPMCFIRLASAGVNTKYCTSGPEDGMVNRIECLPAFWKQLASKRTFTKGDCSPVMQKLSHVLFFSFLLDNRGPKEN